MIKDAPEGLRKFWGDPAKSVLDLTVDFLTRGWSHGALDLRDTLLIVPTQNAGRRMRERLAMEAAKRGTAVLTGPIYLPPKLFAPPPTKRIATGFVAQAFWVSTLRDAPPDYTQQLCPAFLKNTASNPLTLAAHLTALRETLCEEGFTIRTFAERDIPEREQERWRNLAALEDLYLQKLRSHGYCDDAEEKLSTAEHPTIPKDVRRVVVLFTPDPPPLAIRALNALAQKMPVEICVHADKRDEKGFDDWGRPIPGNWLGREIPVKDEQIVVCDDPLDMAERIRQCIMDMHANLRSQPAISVTDRVHADLIATVLAREGIAVFDPAGRPVANKALFTLLRKLFAFKSQPTFRRYLDLARHPHALQSLEEAAGAPKQLLGILESFQNEHLPATLQSARELLDGLPNQKDSKQKDSDFTRIIKKALEEASEWLGILSNASSLAEALEKLLPRLYRTMPVDASLKEEADLLRDFLKRTAVLTDLGTSVADQYAFLEQWVGSVAVSERRTKADAIELLGWLELQWEDAPVLILSDMNDGLVPETISPDAFLPNSLRKAVRLRDNDQRYARDAYVLMSILRCRSSENVKFFTLRRSRDGNPLKPSRLLLQCETQTLARRVISLFRDTPSSQVFSQRTPGWRLKPPVPSDPFPVPEISVADFRSYLECPFLFYLKRVMRAQEAQDLKNELDARDFGNLCHTVLAEFGQSDACNNAEVSDIRRALLDLANQHFERKFGRSPPLTVRFQFGIIEKRLMAFAKEQANLRNEGWRIAAVEEPFSLTCNGTKITGRIDRIDFNDKKKCYRIIDYKTSNRTQDPSQAHIDSIKQNSPDFAALKVRNGKVWTDLQLPLYAFAYEKKQEEKGELKIEVAHFYLPDDPQKTELILWSDWSPELSADAWECAQRILDRMRHGVFWPPQKNIVSQRPSSFWEILFPGPIKDCLDEQFVKEMDQLLERYASQQAKEL